MKLMNGYEFESTFWEDFTIADHFGINAVKDTFRRAFNEWKGNYVYLTELVCTCNLKIWEHWEKGNQSLAEVYDSLWRKADGYACDNLKGEELSFFYRVTD